MRWLNMILIALLAIAGVYAAVGNVDDEDANASNISNASDDTSPIVITRTQTSANATSNTTTASVNRTISNRIPGAVVGPGYDVTSTAINNSENVTISANRSGNRIPGAVVGPGYAVTSTAINVSSNATGTNGTMNQTGNDTDLRITTLRSNWLSTTFNDFVYRVKMVLSFSHESQLEILRERIIELEERQDAWNAYNLKVVENIRTESYTPTERNAIFQEVQAEHQQIIKEYMEVSREIKRIEAVAISSNNEQLSEEAREAALLAENSEVWASIELDKTVQFISTDAVRLTQPEVQSIIEREFGFADVHVSEMMVQNISVYVVNATESERVAEYDLRRSIEAIVEPYSGMVLNMNMTIEIESIFMAGDMIAGQGNATAGTNRTSGTNRTGINGTSNTTTRSIVIGGDDDNMTTSSNATVASNRTAANRTSVITRNTSQNDTNDSNASDGPLINLTDLFNRSST
jgi:hypothetical protein